MTKIQYITLSFWHFNFFEGQSYQGLSQLVIRPFGIFQTSIIVSLSYKKCLVSPNSLLFFIYFFRQYLTKILRPNPLSSSSMLFADTWDSFLAQASELTLFQYAARLSFTFTETQKLAKVTFVKNFNGNICKSEKAYFNKYKLRKEWIPFW